jgi:hypothetical protein
MRLPDGFVARVEQRHGFGAVTSAEALLFACLGIVDVEHPAQLSAVESAGGFSWLELSGSSLSNDVEWRV